MSTEENKTVVRRYIEAIDNNDSSDWSVLDEFVAEDAVVQDLVVDDTYVYFLNGATSAEIKRFAK